MQIIIPYRDRAEHLKKFVQIYKNFDIVVVEQYGNKLFNRAKLLNIGFNETTDKIVCFHDVDLIAHDLNIYKTPFKDTIHLSGLCEQFNYKVIYDTCFGGVTMFTEEAYLKCNGASNDYWGWGGEDDDLYNRTKLAGLDIQFNPFKYYSQKHRKQTLTRQYEVNKQLCTSTDKTWQNSGLNSLRYDILKEDTIFGVKRILVNI